MRNIRIYQAEQFEVGQPALLDKASSNHLLRVLRLKNNQLFTLFNGHGGEFSALLEIDGKKAVAHITDFTKTDNESPLKINLFQGISKGDRMDFVVQKSVELGVNKITPVICERTVVNLKGERLQKKLEHWTKIAISACEQSGRNYLPEISPVCNLSDLLSEKSDELKLLLDPLSDKPLNYLAPQSNKLSILIGPEGGLSNQEIEFAKQQGYNCIQFGPRILRTETAALAVVSAAQLLWGDMG